MSDSFLSHWRNLEDIILIKVDLVEAGLASGLPWDAARHPLWVTMTVPRGNPLLPGSRQDIRLRGGDSLRRDDPIWHGRKLSIILTRTHKIVTSIL